MALASYLKEGGVSDIKVSQSIYSGLQQISQGSNFDQIANTLRPAFLNADLQILTRISASGDLKRSLNHLTDCEEVIKKINVARLFWAETLLSYYQWRSDVRAHEIHQAWILLGADMLAHYQSQKEILRVQDFSDLEAYTAQIMLSSDIAAYLQARLDAKYKHLLIDEFQDTNPIQWQILLSWLNAYGQDVHKPTVFLVGDPKQSIYRFRRADVRLFGVAKKYLEDNFSAKYHLFNETRRNSPAVLQAVNQVFGLSDLPETYPFKEQKRNASAKNLYGHGDVFLLPLISPKEIVKPLTRNALKLPYVDVNSETKQKQSYEEAVQVAKLIRWLKDSRSAQWNDFLVLMRSRTHLRQVENAFRDFGIPCDSPRQGGLLKTLEADDLIALLSVLVTPSDDLSLTQVLRSPIYSLSDDQLLNLVNYQQVNEFDSLWIAISKSDCFFHHAYTQIIRWVELAKTLPVHDLLDFIYHDAEIRLRYAQSVPALQLDRVLSNLDAFLLLALDLDGGRYPSLPRFIRELKQIKRGAEEESPDEGDSADQESDELTDSQTKRVRIMTIHAAKGLEARFVFIMNANANRFNKDSVGVLMNWPPESTSPTHISPFFSDKLKDLARQELRDEEEKIAEIENWNLLYVALTRAKESIYISGLEVSGSNGIAEKSWYGRLMKAGVPKISSELLTATDLSVSINENLVVELNEYLDFQVNWKGHSSPRLYFDEEIISVEQKILIDKGVAFHKLMEHLMRSNITESKDLPSEIHLMNWLSLDSSYVSDLRNAANHLLSSSITKKFFSDPLIMNSWNELDISDDAGRILRIDRLIELPNELIIVDYKMNIPDVGHDLYQKYSEQLATYRRCITSLRTDKPVKSYLLTPKGDVLELR
jgi:ATP-dependent helicase/nuclease subunit A